MTKQEVTLTQLSRSAFQLQHESVEESVSDSGLSHAVLNMQIDTFDHVKALKASAGIPGLNLKADNSSEFTAVSKKKKNKGGNKTAEPPKATLQSQQEQGCNSIKKIEISIEFSIEFPSNV